MRKSVNDIGGENWGPIPLGQKETPGWAKLSAALRATLGDNGAPGRSVSTKGAGRVKKWAASAIMRSAISKWVCR